MAHIPMTAGAAFAAGFTPIPNHNRLFSNENIPGFLFRVVTTIEEALACGGILLRNDATTVMYFGREAIDAHEAGLLGSILLPNRMDLEIRHDIPVGSAPYAYWGMSGAIGSWFNSPAVVDGAFIGVVCAATGGMVTMANSGPGANPNGTHGLAGQVVVPEKTEHAAALAYDVRNARGFFASGDDPRGPFVPAVGNNWRCTGYIEISWELGKRAYLSAIQDAFLGSVPSDLQGHYRDAYESEVAEIDPAEKTRISMKLFSQAGNSNDAVSRPLVWTTKPQVHRLTRHRMDVYLAATNSPWPTSTSNTEKAFYYTLLSTAHGRVKGQVLPSIRPTYYLNNDYSSAFLEPAVGKFSAMAIPFGRVKLSEKQTVSTASVLGRVFMLGAVAPDDAEKVWDMAECEDATYEAQFNTLSDDAFPEPVGTSDEVNAKVIVGKDRRTKRKAIVANFVKSLNQDQQDRHEFLERVNARLS